MYDSPNFLGEHGVLSAYWGGTVAASGVWPRSRPGALGVVLAGALVSADLPAASATTEAEHQWTLWDGK